MMIKWIVGLLVVVLFLIFILIMWLRWWEKKEDEAAELRELWDNQDIGFPVIPYDAEDRRDLPLPSGVPQPGTKRQGNAVSPEGASEIFSRGGINYL